MGDSQEGLHSRLDRANQRAYLCCFEGIIAAEIGLVGQNVFEVFDNGDRLANVAMGVGSTVCDAQDRYWTGKFEVGDEVVLEGAIDELNLVCDTLCAC